MAIATTATRAELVALYNAVYKLQIALRQVVDGSGTAAAPGRFTSAEVDTLIAAADAAITAATA